MTSSQRGAGTDSTTTPLASPKGPHELTLSFDDNKRASLVVGHYDQNLAHLERRLSVIATVNGNHITIKGSKETVERARKTLELLYEQARTGKAFSVGDVDGAMQEAALQGSLFPTKPEAGKISFEQIVTRKRGPVRARNAARSRSKRTRRQVSEASAECCRATVASRCAMASTL